MDWEDAFMQWAPLRDLVARAEKIPELERRITELERRLITPPCPSCHLPTWHVVRSEPDPARYDIGGVRRTYHCESCKFEESRLEV